MKGELHDPTRFREPQEQPMVLICKAQIKDAPAMARVMVDTWLVTYRHQIPDAAWQKRKEEWTYAVSEKGWTECLTEIAQGDPMCIFVAEADANTIAGLAVGYPTDDDKIGEISALYVSEMYQGQGVGRRLIQAVATQLAEKGVTTLHIGVLAANESARAFYEAIGGRVVGERHFDEDGVLLPEVVYGWPDIMYFVNEQYRLDKI